MSLPPRPLQYNPPTDPLTILHQDSDLLVLSKPSGLLSVPGKAADHADSLETRARADFPEALLVHRLDLETSGVFVMALNKAAQANLGKQFERRKTQKTYIARVWGRPEEDEGHIDLPLRCDWDNRPRQMVCYEHGKPAQTDWRAIGHDDNTTRLSLSPITGRSHQLRVHMAEIGHPILGDPFYAPEDVFEAADRLQLHALSLTIHHPKDGELITFKDPCPF